MTEPAVAAAPQISLSVGDRVVYPNQGLCTVTAIKTEEIAGQKLVFVSLQVVETGAMVKAPQEKLARIGIRRLSNADDVKRVFEFLKSDSERASLDWKKRARDNTLRLSEGGLRGLAEVVKGLQVLSELRPLPPKERELYNDARHLVITEIAAALSGAECDAEDALDIVLFPVGKERPKRSIEEFKELGDEDGLGLGDDLLGLDGDAVEEPEEPAEAAESGNGDDDGDAPAKKPAKAAKAAKPAKPAKEKAAPKKKKAAAVVKDDIDEDDDDDVEKDADDEAEEGDPDDADGDADGDADADADADVVEPDDAAPPPVAKKAAKKAPAAKVEKAEKKPKAAKAKPAAAPEPAAKKRGRPKAK